MSTFQIYIRLSSFLWNVNKNGLIILSIVAFAESVFSVLTIVGVAPFADYLTNPKLEQVNEITAFFVNLLNKYQVEPSLLIFGAIFVILNILRTLLEVVVKFVTLLVKYQITEIVNTQLADNMVRSKWQFIKTLSQGKLINTLTRETGILGDSAGILCLQITYVTKFLVLLSFPLLLFPHFIMTFLAILIVLFVPYLFLQKLNYRLGKVTTETSNKTIEKLSDLIRTIKPIKTYQVEERAVQNYRKTLRKHYSAATKSHTLSHAILSGYQTLGVVALVATTLIFNHMLISEMAIIVWAMVQTLPLIARIFASNSNLISFFPSFEQVEATNENAKINFDKPGGMIVDNIREIVFRDVSYRADENNILAGVSLTFKKGQITALCGHSGSGKSTLLEMVFGLISPTKGQIFVNGINMSRLSHASFRSRVAYCSQESLIMSGSIYDNLSFVVPDVSVTNATEALNFAEAEALINNKRGGINATAGVNGNNLSGGERQKISLAQAYIKNPDVFLFDEITASIDTVSEHKLLEKMKQLKKDKMIIMITHNTSSLKYADNIIMMDSGRVVSYGDHKTLRKTSKIFQQFIMSTTPDKNDNDHDLD